MAKGQLTKDQKRLLAAFVNRAERIHAKRSGAIVVSRPGVDQRWLERQQRATQYALQPPTRQWWRHGRHPLMTF